MKSPLTADQRQWIDERFAWLHREFGDRPLRGPVITPTADYFPDRYSPTRECVEALFGRVCKYMQVDRSRIDLHFYVSPNADTVANSFAPRPSQGYALGVYYEENGRIAVWLEQSRLDEPTAIIATIAHELGHVHLLADRRYDERTPDNERLTDLLTVFFGFGIFTANSAVREVNWHSGGWSGWQASRQGYLSFPEYAYALALYTNARGDHKPAWARYLRRDMRALLKLELEQLASRSAHVASRDYNPTVAVDETEYANEQELAARDDVNYQEHGENAEPAQEEAVACDELILDGQRSEHDHEDGEQDDNEDGEQDGYEDDPPHASNADALYTLGVVHANQGNYEQAVQLYTEALELKPKDEEIWLHRGKAYFGLGEFEASVADCSQALRYIPDDFEALRARARAYLWLQRFGDAVVDLDKAQRQEKRDPQLYFLRGLAQLGLGNHKHARSDLDYCIQLEPQWADPYLARGRLYEALGNVPRARADVALAIHCDPALAEEATRVARLPKVR